MTKCRVSWDSYQKNISSGLSILQQHGEFVDMTIATAGHLVKVHKSLLALASPYIKAMIQTVPCQHPVIFLSNIHEEILGLILEYVYTGEVLMPTQKMEPFLKACQDLHIIGLQKGVPSKLLPDTGGNLPNSIKINKPSNETSQMIPQQTVIGSNTTLLNKQAESKERAAYTVEKQNSVKTSVGLNKRGTSDNGFEFDDTNIKKITVDVDQHTYQLDEATHSEPEASVHGLNDMFKQKDTAAMNVDKELIAQSHQQNTEFFTPTYANKDSIQIENSSDVKSANAQSTSSQVVKLINLDTSIPIDNAQDMLVHKDKDPKIVENTSKIKLLTKSTEDFEHKIGVHVIDTQDSSSNNIQDIQLDSTAELQLVPTLCLNQSNAGNCIMLNYDKTIYNVQNEHDTRTGYAYDNNERDECTEMEQDVTAENTILNNIKLNYDKNNRLLETIEQSETIYDYIEKRTENSNEKFESAVHTNTDPKASYNVNVELPGSCKGPPIITIMSGAILNNPPTLRTVDHNTVPGKFFTVKPTAESLAPPVADVPGSAPLYMVNGKRKLQMIFNRFIYSVHHTSKCNKRWRWRCIDYRHKRCPAYIDTVGDLIVDRRHAHSHPFHDEKVLNLGSRRRVFSSLKEIQEQVGEPLDKLHNIDLGFLNDL